MPFTTFQGCPPLSAPAAAHRDANTLLTLLAACAGAGTALAGGVGRRAQQSFRRAGARSCRAPRAAPTAEGAEQVAAGTLKP
jgi:predicted Fe-Mo cluster-binding NifX family protein